MTPCDCRLLTMLPSCGWAHRKQVLSRQRGESGPVCRRSGAYALEMPGRRIRTSQPYDFLELSPGQFEDLVRQLATTSGVTWTRAPEPVGRLGSDHGRDIRATEEVAATDSSTSIDREWRYQAKRYKEIGPSALRDVVREAVPDHSDPPYALVTVVACRVSDAGFEAFSDETVKAGITHAELWTRDTLNDKLVLNQNARIAAFYFGDGPAVEGTLHIPLALDRSAARDVPLLAREDERAALLAAHGDVIIVGRPGTGKTRLATEADHVRFLNSNATDDAVAESIRLREPANVVVDDAGFALDKVEVLLELRRGGYQFAIVATAWTEHLADVARLLPDATVVRLELLERKPMDELLQAVGIGNYYLRGEILAQAQGRAGWAVALADMAKRGGDHTVTSGRGLIDQVRPYLSRIGASSTTALGMMSVLAALGRVAVATELSEMAAFLSISRLELQQLLREAAAVGVLETEGGTLRIEPEALRYALVGYWFFEQEPAPWPVRDVLDRWPTHRDDVIHAVLEAAWDGSAKGRRELDALLPSIASLPSGDLEKFVALDEAAAERAIDEIDRVPAIQAQQVEILTTAVKRWAMSSATARLLDLAIGDTRPEHSNPNHPIRVLGEVGSRISPHGATSFDARARILDAATTWLDANPTAPRRLVWARLIAHLLQPGAEGNFADLGSPMTIKMQAGFESPAHLRAIASELWAPVAARVGMLESEALVALIDVVDDWIRVQRRLEGAFGAKPTEAQAVAAREFLQVLVPAISAGASGKPAAQMALRETTRLFRVGIRQAIDPEYRLLNWMPWRLPMRGKSGLIASAVERLATCWATEDPTVLMARLARWSAEAARQKRDLQPMIHVALEALSRKAADIEALIAAGQEAGLTWQLSSLYRASVAATSELPGWFEDALRGEARVTVLRAALEPSSNECAAATAITNLGPADLFVVELALMTRSQTGPDEVARALLHHADEDVRGYASIWFSLGAGDHGVTLPGDWYNEWAEAFVMAPLHSPRGNNYKLGEKLRRLVVSDPELVQRWFLRRLRLDADGTMWDLPDQAKATFHWLPLEQRDRIVRSVESAPVIGGVLEVLLGDDLEWLDRLLDDDVLDTDVVLATLNHSEREVPQRVAHLMRLASILVPHGVDAKRLAWTAELGGWTGEASSNCEAIRSAFDGVQTDDPSARQVREVGIALFEQQRNEALRQERARRVTGDL